MNDSNIKCPIKQSKPFSSLAYLAKSTITVNGSKSDYESAKVLDDSKTSVTSSSSTISNSDNVVAAPVAMTNGSSCHDHKNAIINGQLTTSSQFTLLGTDNHKSKNNVQQISTTTTATTTSTLSTLDELCEETFRDTDEIDCVNKYRKSSWELQPNSYVKNLPSSLIAGHSPAALAAAATTTTTTTNGYIEHNGIGNGFPSLSSKYNSMDNWDYTIELECLQGPQDLQLAAELGKTLLERNKELEILLKEHKNTVEEQEQEIVYLKKHTTALREVNDSRLKVYEQLEVGIQDLERANHRLIVENTSDKKHLKALSQNIENLETRCDEITKQLEETRQALAIERRKNERLLQEKSSTQTDGISGVRLRTTEQQKNSTGNNSASIEGFDANTTAPENCSFAFKSPGGGTNKNANSTGISGTDQSNDDSMDLTNICTGEENEEIIKLVNDLETTKKAFMAEQQRCGELEEQLVAIIQENQTLQGRIAQNSANEEMKSVHDELSILDEVRQGQMCSRCLRACDDRNIMNDEQSSIAPTEEGDDEENSLLDMDVNIGHMVGGETIDRAAAYRSSVSIKMSSRNQDDLSSLDMNAPASPNPYRDLVEKYEALLEVQRSSIARKSNNGGLSLAEEFQSTDDFNQTQKLMIQAAAAAVEETCNASSHGDAASSCNMSLTHEATGANKGVDMATKNRGRTPTEFSEAETSSSGYSDETSNKCTQTEDRPGYFLCSIGDGEDCKFSIYDDVSPIDSRFRNRPEYRELFKEIFAVLKKAAENKEEGDKLPLLDDTHPNNPAMGANSTTTTAKVPPVTPANEELPVDFGDDTQSIISSAVSEQSFAMSECITKLERKTAKKHIIEKNQENKPPTASTASISQLPVTICSGAIAGTGPGSVAQFIENGRILTPLKREPLEYLSVGVGIKKKNRKKNRNFSNDRSESPLALPSPPRFYVSSGKKRKDVRPFVQSPIALTPEQQQQEQVGGNGNGMRPSRNTTTGGGAKYEWKGNSMVIYNRTMNSPQQQHAAGLRGRELDLNSVEYRPSTVSQDLHKLKKLDLSYAEVLRRADACKHHQQQRRRHHH